VGRSDQEARWDRLGDSETRIREEQDETIELQGRVRQIALRGQLEEIRGNQYSQDERRALVKTGLGKV